MELWAWNATFGFDLDHDLDLEFSRSNMEFAISQPKMVGLPRNKKQTYRLNSRPQMWPWGLTLAMTLTLNFQAQIWNLLYLSQKWSSCHGTKSKHIDWTQGLKCDHGVWPWPWPWPWIFKVKYEICYISIKSDPKVRCKDLQVSDRGDIWCRRAVDSSSCLHRKRNKLSQTHLLDFGSQFAAINHCKEHFISISFIGYLKQLCWKP